MDALYRDRLPAFGVAAIFQQRLLGDRALALQHVVVLFDVAFFQILEAEVRAEEARAAILRGDAALAVDRGRPHPLIGRAIRIVQHQQRHALHIGWRREPDDDFAVPVRAETLVGPAPSRTSSLSRRSREAAPDSAATRRASASGPPS